MPRLPDDPDFFADTGRRSPWLERGDAERRAAGKPSLREQVAIDIAEISAMKNVIDPRTGEPDPAYIVTTMTVAEVEARYGFTIIDDYPPPMTAEEMARAMAYIEKARR